MKIRSLLMAQFLSVFVIACVSEVPNAEPEVRTEAADGIAAGEAAVQTITYSNGLFP